MLFHQTLFLSLSLSLRVSCQEMEGFVEYRPGDSNLILSVPHGGSNLTDEMPDRIKCCRQVENPEENCFNTTDGHRCAVVLYPDLGTVPIAYAIEKYLIAEGLKPHMVVNHLHRVKLDVNRNIDEAAQGDPKATEVYNEYHATLDRVKENLTDALILDLHGQSHIHNLTELGYLRISKQLNAEDYNATNSSIRRLSERRGLSGKELMIGQKSFGALMENAGFGAIPSPNNTFPNERKYYAGGHITRRHGSREQGTIDCIQVEMPLIVRKETSPLRENFTESLSDAIYKFYMEFYAKKTT